MQKSNPPLLEWLGSPIIYKEAGDTAARLREIITRCYSPAACKYHYLNIARGNFRAYLQGDTISPKKYFYVLRPLLAMQWLEQNKGVVPTDFNVMMADLLPAGVLRADIEQLIHDKKSGKELDKGARIRSISEFVESELARWETIPIANEKNSASTEELNALFRESLDFG